MLKIYGVPNSQPVRAVVWLCLIKRLPFEFVMTSQNVTAKQSEYLVKVNMIFDFQPPYGAQELVLQWLHWQVEKTVLCKKLHFGLVPISFANGHLQPREQIKMTTATVCKSYHLFSFDCFSQFSLDIKGDSMNLTLG